MALVQPDVDASILVVDDDDVNRQLAVDFFTFKGLRAVGASTAAEAWRIISALKPAAVVLDIQMPDVSGLDLLERIRSSADKSTAGTFVVAATALAMKGDRERCLQAGADAYLSRPFSWSQLLQLVAERHGGQARSA